MDQFELRKRKNNPVFVASWTTPPPPDPPPPPWPPPHFHGHVFEAFSILQGEYHVSFSKECAEIFQQVDLAGLCIDYRTKPSVHLQRTDITYHMRLWLNPTVHARFFNFSLGPMMAHGAPNARQPSSHHTTSCNGYIHPEPSSASYCECTLVLNASAQRDSGMPKWWSMARSALVSTPIVYSAIQLDARWCGTGGAAWSVALPDVVHLAHQ